MSTFNLRKIMFKKAHFFRIPKGYVLPDDLELLPFLPCGATQPESIGWVPPRGEGALIERVGCNVILKLCIERRTVPASAINEAVDAMVETYKRESGRERVSAKIKKEFRETAILDLLPRAFTRRSAVNVWLDPVAGFLVVDGSPDKVVTELVTALDGLKVLPVQTSMTASAAMAHWLREREGPALFTVDRDCELRTPDDQKSSVRYARHTLETDEVVSHIQAGKLPTKLAMTWNDRVSFVLTDCMQLTGIKMLDVVLDDKPEGDAFDGDAAIVTGELSMLIPDLILALGGELDTEYRVWPDGTVQDCDELLHSHMSDDFTVVVARDAEHANELVNA